MNLDDKWFRKLQVLCILCLKHQMNIFVTYFFANFTLGTIHILRKHLLEGGVWLEKDNFCLFSICLRRRGSKKSKNVLT